MPSLGGGGNYGGNDPTGGAGGYGDFGGWFQGVDKSGVYDPVRMTGAQRQEATFLWALLKVFPVLKELRFVGNKAAKAKGYDSFEHMVVFWNNAKTGDSEAAWANIVDVIDQSVEPEQAAAIKEQLANYKAALDAGHNQDNAAIQAIDGSSKLTDKEKLDAKRAYVAAVTGDEIYDPNSKGGAPPLDSWVQYYEQRNFQFEDPNSEELRSGVDKWGRPIRQPVQQAQPPADDPVNDDDVQAIGPHPYYGPMPDAGGPPPTGTEATDNTTGAGGPGGSTGPSAGAGPPSRVGQSQYITPKANPPGAAKYGGGYGNFNWGSQIPPHLAPFWNALNNMLFGENGMRYQKMLVEDMRWKQGMLQDYVKKNEGLGAELKAVGEKYSKPTYSVALGGQKLDIVPKRNIMVMNALGGLMNTRAGIQDKSMLAMMEHGGPNAASQEWVKTLMNAIKGLPAYTQPKQEEKGADWLDWAGLVKTGVDMYGKYKDWWD